MKNLVNILEEIKMYWFKGYISDKKLFEWIFSAIKDEKNPFELNDYIKQLVLNCFEVNAVLKRAIATDNPIESPMAINYLLSSSMVDRNVFDELWESEFRRLLNLIGNEKEENCPCCGKPANAKVIIADETEYTVENGIYWETNCSDKNCGKWYTKVTEKEGRNNE